jgi:hypothetical protein
MYEHVEAAEREGLPALYQRWVDELYPAGIPRETVATCLDCAMCPKPGDDSNEGLRFYNPASKCCTYFPSLPNYLVGGALPVETHGAEVLRNFVAQAGGTQAEVTLLGVTTNHKYKAIYDTVGQEIFGQDAELLCPYAIAADTPEGPLCGIWQHRNAVCATYFCKHVRGSTGRSFWMGLRNLFMSVEVELAWWCIGELFDDPGAVIAPSAGSTTNRKELTLRDDAWKAWPDTKEAFFRACAERVQPLTWDEVCVIAGARTRLHQHGVDKRYESLRDTQAPERLLASQITVVRAGAERSLIQSDPRGEIFELPSVLIQLLPYFDGRSTREILEEIHQNHSIEIDESLIRRLCDFGVVAAPE